MAGKPNRRRTFADVVAIDAWHETFSGARRVSLHADVVFGTARVGGEMQSKVRFRLSVQRAELVLVTPESEPVSVDIESVSRDGGPIKGKWKETIKNAADARASAKAGFSISLT